MMAAKVFVSLCSPLVAGGNWDSWVRKFDDFATAGARLLVAMC